MNTNEIAKKLKVSTTLLNRITGALIVTEEPITTKHHDIGLRIRFPKHEKEVNNKFQRNKISISMFQHCIFIF